MDLETLRAFDVCFHSLRGYLWLLPFTDAFLQSLVDNKVISEEIRYTIFASPSPTIFRKSQRVITFIRVLVQSRGELYTPFLLFIFKFEAENEDSWGLQLFLTTLNTRMRTYPLLRTYLNGLRSQRA